MQYQDSFLTVGDSWDETVWRNLQVMETAFVSVEKAKNKLIRLE